MWLACNAALDRAASHGDRNAPSVASGNQPVLSDSRKAAMQRAVHFARGYPPRNWTPRPSSPWIMCLRGVLKRAPAVPSRRAWGARVDDLEFFEAPGSRRGRGHYQWSCGYIERVLRVLRRVFVAYGDRQTVRRYALWEIYDAVRPPRVLVFLGQDADYFVDLVFDIACVRDTLRSRHGDVVGPRSGMARRQWPEPCGLGAGRPASQASCGTAPHQPQFLPFSDVFSADDVFGVGFLGAVIYSWARSGQIL